MKGFAISGEDFASLMQGKVEDTGGGSDLTDEQTITRLKEGFALSQPHDYRFTPGEPIKHRFPNMSGTRSSDGPSLFMKYLPKPFVPVYESGDVVDNFTSANISVMYDCAILYLVDGERIVEWIACSHHYEPIDGLPQA